MTHTHPLTPSDELLKQWYAVGYTGNWRNALTLADRWGHQQRVRSGPEWPLVERVADAIAAEATSAGIVNDRPARAAILEVAAWLTENYASDVDGPPPHQMLRDEAAND